MTADPAPETPGDRPVARRKVFYIPGFDPFHPRRYRELYRREAAKQAAVSGHEIAQAKGRTAFEWTVTACIEGRRVQTDIEVLVWSDIVAASMAASIPATYGQMLRTGWVYLRCGALGRLLRLGKGPVIAAFYPVAMLLLQLAVATTLGWLAVQLLDAGLRRVGVGAPVRAVLGAAVFVVVAALVLRWFKARDNRLLAHFLMQDFAFVARWNGAYPPVMEARLRQFADRVAEALGSDADEVLLVGHSSGAHLAVSVMSDLLRAGRISSDRCALLTLGQVVPMVSFLPDASRLRRDLHAMGGQDLVPWVDVTAPGDGCAFALCDPVAVTGVAPAAPTGPLVLSAAFSRTLSPETRARLRYRYFRLHFQYLCAFDALPGKPDDYDYFAITAGPRRLGERFAGRRSSPSVRRAPTNPYRDMAP